jgi:hypothetical protein
LYNLIDQVNDQMKDVRQLILEYVVFDDHYVNEIYDDIQYIIVVKHIYNNHVMLIQFHLDLKTNFK